MLSCTQPQTAQAPARQSVGGRTGSGGGAGRRRGADLVVGELADHHARVAALLVHRALEGRAAQRRVEGREEGEARGGEALGLG